MGRQLQLAFASVPKLVLSSFESKGKNGNGYGRKGSNDAPGLIKNLSNLDSDEWNKLIRGAVFLFGLFGYFAYFIVTRDKRENTEAKRKPNDEPK